MENNIISAEFSHFRHIKTRKVVVLECEISEESFQDAISKLGMPIGGESKPVAIALLAADKIPTNKLATNTTPAKEQTEGERLRTRAALLPKELNFTRFLVWYDPTLELGEENRIDWIRSYCEITSRSELAKNLEAQAKFKELLAKYESWKLENSYKDNLGRV